jgi:ABC-type polysaccharide/polyol phosphate transport system ATPase subunit
MILVNNLKKIYPINNNRTLFDTILNRYKIKKYKIVLQNINLKFELGKIYGLFGRNGSGKSTLLRIISKIEYPSNGNVEIIDKKKLFSLLEKEYLFEDEFSLSYNLKNLMQYMCVDKKNQSQIINEIFQFNDLELKCLNDCPKNIEKKKLKEIILSAGIFCDPDIIIIDEFFNNISNNKKSAFLHLLKKNISKKIIIIVSHDMRLLKTFCNFFIWLDSGIVKKISEDNKIIDEYAGDLNEVSENLQVLSNVNKKNNYKFELLEIDIKNNFIKNFKIVTDTNSFKDKNVKFKLSFISLLDNNYGYKIGLSINSNLKTILSQTDNCWKKKNINNEFHLNILIPNIFLVNQNYNFFVSIKAEKETEKGKSKVIHLLLPTKFLIIHSSFLNKILLNDTILNEANSAYR